MQVSDCKLGLGWKLRLLETLHKDARCLASDGLRKLCVRRSALQDLREARAWFTQHAVTIDAFATRNILAKTCHCFQPYSSMVKPYCPRLANMQSTPTPVRSRSPSCARWPRRARTAKFWPTSKARTTRPWRPTLRCRRWRRLARRLRRCRSAAACAGGFQVAPSLQVPACSSAVAWTLCAFNFPVQPHPACRMYCECNVDLTPQKILAMPAVCIHC